VQNFGLRNGLPGTPYNKAVKAVEGIAAILIPVLREALADEEDLMKQNTVIGRLMCGLREEGADIMLASRDEKAQYFISQSLFLMFAGVASSLKLCHSAPTRKSELIANAPATLIHHQSMHEYSVDVLVSLTGQKLRINHKYKIKRDRKQTKQAVLDFAMYRFDYFLTSY
jgi:hypothetical protein